MKVIAYTNNGFENLTSPIKHVVKHVPESIFKIAPERSSDVLCKYLPLSLAVPDIAEWECKINLIEHEIRISRGLIEMLWCAAYGYYVFYTKHVANMSFYRNRVAIDVTKDAEVDAGLKLLAWAYNNSLLDNPVDEWPAGAPEPSHELHSESFVSVANELCLCATATLLHHELAHLILHKEQYGNLIELERDVDYAAVDWILDNNFDQTDKRFIKRAMGIAIAYEVLTAHELYRGRSSADKHPPSYDRLVNNLARHITDDHHLVWAFTCTMLTLHFNRANIPLPTEEFESFRGVVDAYADILSKR